jgi:hypothetical protein
MQQEKKEKAVSRILWINCFLNINCFELPAIEV